jgi:hypothetical protein
MRHCFDETTQVCRCCTVRVSWKNQKLLRLLASGVPAQPSSVRQCLKHIIIITPCPWLWGCWCVVLRRCCSTRGNNNRAFLPLTPDLFAVAEPLLADFSHLLFALGYTYGASSNGSYLSIPVDL